MAIAVTLEALEGEYAVTLLPPDQGLPDWIRGDGFVNVSFCSDELSVVTPAARVPAGLKSDGGWRALKLTGQFAFDEAGVVLSVVRPVSEAGLAVFVVSTFHRDYLLTDPGARFRARGGTARGGRAHDHVRGLNGAAAALPLVVPIRARRRCDFPHSAALAASASLPLRDKPRRANAR